MKLKIAGYNYRKILWLNMIKRVFILLVFASLTANFSEVMAQEPKIQLETPQEPPGVIQHFQELWKDAQGGGYGEKMKLTWYVNTGGAQRVVMCLWNAWKNELEPHELSFEDLENIYSNFLTESWDDFKLNSVFFQWMKGEIYWDDVVTTFVTGIGDLIESPC
jgi:hypothetical protein